MALEVNPSKVCRSLSSRNIPQPYRLFPPVITRSYQTSDQWQAKKETLSDTSLNFKRISSVPRRIPQPHRATYSANPSDQTSQRLLQLGYVGACNSTAAPVLPTVANVRPIRTKGNRKALFKDWSQISHTPSYQKGREQLKILPSGLKEHTCSNTDLND